MRRHLARAWPTGLNEALQNGVKGLGAMDGVMGRDLVGYGKEAPQIEWPGGARIAISIVVNYEEGSESTPLYGDDRHHHNADLPSQRPPEGRNLSIETQWEYGARAGVWRLLRILREQQVKATFFVCGMALENNPYLGPEIAREGHECCGHGYRWIPQWNMDRETERQYIQRAVSAIQQTTGRRPSGWFTMGGPGPNTRELLAEEGFLYDCDGLNDDLPYYTQVKGSPFLVVPYSLDTNDLKFWQQAGYEDAGFGDYLKNSFDVLYKEGLTRPKMMSVGLHSRIVGRPGRAAVVERFLEYAKQHDKVWFAGRDEIASWWLAHYPPTSA